MDIDKAKTVFGAADTEENKPRFLNKTDETVYARGRRSFSDIRNKIMHTDKRRFIWGPKFDEKKLDFQFDQDPLKKGFSFFSIGLFTFSMIMMLSAMVYAYYSFTTGGYSVRQDNIVLELEIPTITSAGQDLNGQIIVGNSNRSMFKEAYVTLEVQEGENEPAKIIDQIQIGDVDVGDKIYKNISLNLSGLEGQEKMVSAILYYRIPQSESTFQKITFQKVLITKSPVVMSISGPKDLLISQDGEYVVSVRGVSKTIPSLLLSLDISKNMRVLKSNFPEVAKGVYALGPLNEGEERVFKFTGSFRDAQELGNRFTINVRAGSGEGNEVKAYFAETTYGINLAKNPIQVKLIGQNNQAGNKITFTGKQPKLNLVITNTGNTRVKDAELEIKFSGGLFNAKGVNVDGAVYDSSNFTATANGSNNEKLREIDAGAQIIFPIEFSQLQTNTNVSGRNINLNVSFTSNNEDNDGKPITQRFTTTMTPTEGFTASLDTYYFSGAFKNTGPMPTTVGKPTTFTINLFVDTNAGFSSGKFILPLAPNVTFIKSLDNSVSYNKQSKIVSWNIGNLNKSTTTAFGVAKKETSIQVSILPTPEQVRTAPVLTVGARLEAIGIDREKSPILLEVSDATINISSDPKYVNNRGYESVGE